MKTRSRKTRLLSFVLSLLMVLTLMPDISVQTYAYDVGTVIPETDYLTFTAETNATIAVTTYRGTFQYQTKAEGAESYSGWSSDSNDTSINLNEGDSVRFMGSGVTFNNNNHVSIPEGKVACSGDVCSLRLNNEGEFQGLEESCFAYMFYDCNGLTTAPELPATTLADNCYVYMFSYCDGLTTAPALPATELADSCYEGMFNDCDGLTTAPALPATKLADGCYVAMFSYCDGLTTAPALPATELKPKCYEAMFFQCTGLTEAPELPATTLASECYKNMFIGCTGLTTAPALPATTLTSYCYNSMFYRCTGIRLSETKNDEYKYPYTIGQTSAFGALNNMFENTGGTFQGTPVVGKTYYMDSSIHKFNAASTEVERDKLQYEFTGALGKDIKKIEVLMDIESFAENGWGQVVYQNGGGDEQKKYTLFNNPGIKKYTAEGQLDGITFAGVQLIGKGTLLAYTITFADNTTVSSGSWSYPTYTAPAAVTGLSYTGTAQELVTAGTVTGGTIKYLKVISLGNYTVLSIENMNVNDIYQPADEKGIIFPKDYKLTIAETTYLPVTDNLWHLDNQIKLSFKNDKCLICCRNDYNLGKSVYLQENIDALRITAIDTVNKTITAEAVNTDALNTSQLWSETVPTATDAGTYPVYYRIDANAGYQGVAATKIADVKIGKADSLVAAPSSKNPSYYNSAVQLINAGTVQDGCKIEYALGTDATTAPTSGWETDATKITANQTGTFYVWYKVTGDDVNYADAAPKCLTVKVTQAKTWTLSMPDYIYDGTAHEPTIKGMTFGKLTYTYFTSAGICIGSTAPTEPGDYRVSVAASGDDTHPSKLESAYYTIKSAKFAAGNTVSFKEKVEFNYLVEATDAETVEGAYVVFTYDHYGEKMTVKKPINKDDMNGKYYRVRLPLTASEMAIDIKAELYLPTLDKPVDTKARSIKDYAEAAIKSNLDGAEVLKAMLNYGGYTQTALGNNTTLLANSGEGIAVDVSSVAPKSATPFVRPTATAAKVTYKGSTAMTVSDVYVRHYFAVDSSLTSSELNAVMVKVGDNAPVSITKLPKNNTGYYCETTPELAYELDRENGSIVVYGFAGAETADSENAISIENYNVIDYCEAVAGSNKQTDAAKNMAKALYSYYTAAKAYVDSRA